MSSVASLPRARQTSSVVFGALIACSFAFAQPAQAGAFEEALPLHGVTSGSSAKPRRGAFGRWAAQHLPGLDARIRSHREAVRRFPQPGKSRSIWLREQASGAQKRAEAAEQIMGDMRHLKKRAHWAFQDARSVLVPNETRQAILGDLMHTLKQAGQQAIADRDHHGAVFENHFADAFALAPQIADDLGIMDDLIALVYDPHRVSWSYGSDRRFAFEQVPGIGMSLVEMHTHGTECSALSEGDGAAQLIRVELLKNPKIQRRVTQALVTRGARLAWSGTAATQDADRIDRDTIDAIRARASELIPAVAALVEARVPSAPRADEIGRAWHFLVATPAPKSASADYGRALHNFDRTGLLP